MVDWVGLDLEKWTHGHLCVTVRDNKISRLVRKCGSVYLIDSSSLVSYKMTKGCNET